MSFWIIPKCSDHCRISITIMFNSQLFFWLLNLLWPFLSLQLDVIRELLTGDLGAGNRLEVLIYSAIYLKVFPRIFCYVEMEPLALSIIILEGFFDPHSGYRFDSIMKFLFIGSGSTRVKFPALKMEAIIALTDMLRFQDSYFARLKGCHMQKMHRYW